MTMCGIPKVSLLGKVEDWTALRAKIDRLLEFDVKGQMKDWHNYLVKVLDKLVESAEGKDCLEFWD